MYVTHPCCVHNFKPVYVSMGGNEENEGSLDLFGVQKRVFINRIHRLVVVTRGGGLPSEDTPSDKS